MEEYEVLNKIGGGTFGTVYLSKRRSLGDKTTGRANKRKDSNIFFAIKRMKKRYYDWDDCVKLREVRVLMKLNHRNIVLLKEVIRENDRLYLVFEHMEENLYQLMRNQLDPFPEETICRIINQILSGLAHIHKNGFFHRDIKPENLLCRDGANLIKIADFGLSREIDSEPPFTDYISTRWYRAPELLLHSRNYHWAVDIWAVGCVMSELYTLRPIFPGRSEIDQIYKICQVLGSPNVVDWPEGERLASLVQVEFPNIVPLDISDFLSNSSPQGLSLVNMMLLWIPSKRSNARDLMHHSYFESQKNFQR